MGDWGALTFQGGVYFEFDVQQGRLIKWGRLFEEMRYIADGRRGGFYYVGDMKTC